MVRHVRLWAQRDGILDGVLDGVLDGDITTAYEIAFDVARTIRSHFPAFYDAHVAHLATTSGSLLGVCCALWRLVEAAGVPLRWPDDGARGYGVDLGDDAAADPVDCLSEFDDVSAEYMSGTILPYAIGPAPHYYGIGVYEALDTDWDQTDALTVTLWYLFQHTPWSIGIDIEALLSGVDEDLSICIRGQRPLPANASLHQLSTYLVLPPGVNAAPFDLLAYSMAQHPNPLASHTDYEIERNAMELGDEELWGWDAVPTLVQYAREAREVAQAYARWQRIFNADGATEDAVIVLGRMLRRAARRARLETTATPLIATPLIEILGGALDQHETHERIMV